MFTLRSYMYIVVSVQYDDVSVILFNLHNYTGTGLNAQHSTISNLARIYSYVHKQHSTLSYLAQIYSYVHKQHSTLLKPNKLSSLKFYVLSVSLEQINFTNFKSLWTTCIGEVNKLVLVKGYRIRTSTHEIYK